ncbi:hypothetical protein F4861DRAFT_507639 [Xylaria intraflava]|nr:hypothetical protein F4861DRAFT_507639 [Xylaria intraflava]
MSAPKKEPTGAEKDAASTSFPKEVKRKVSFFSSDEFDLSDECRRAMEAYRRGREGMPPPDFDQMSRPYISNKVTLKRDDDSDVISAEAQPGININAQPQGEVNDKLQDPIVKPTDTKAQPYIRINLQPHVDKNVQFSSDGNAQVNINDKPSRPIVDNIDALIRNFGEPRIKDEPKATTSNDSPIATAAGSEEIRPSFLDAFMGVNLRLPKLKPMAPGCYSDSEDPDQDTNYDFKLRERLQQEKDLAISEKEVYRRRILELQGRVVGTAETGTNNLYLDLKLVRDIRKTLKRWEAVSHPMKPVFIVIRRTDKDEHGKTNEITVFDTLVKATAHALESLLSYPDAFSTGRHFFGTETSPERVVTVIDEIKRPAEAVEKKDEEWLLLDKSGVPRLGQLHRAVKSDRSGPGTVRPFVFSGQHKIENFGLHLQMKLLDGSKVRVSVHCRGVNDLGVAKA